MFSVPITLFSCASRGLVAAESTTSRVSITVSISAAFTILRISACWFETRTNSVRFELARRVLRIDSDDRLDVRVLLQCLREPAAPVRGQAGQQDAAALGHGLGIFSLARPHLRNADRVPGRTGRIDVVSPTSANKGMRSKEAIRRSVWTAMEREGVARFPGARERIPNFANARAASERLARHPAWKKAKTIKANPDAPQTHSRRLALEQGKTLVMAVPRLRDAHPFRLLDPAKLNEEQIREAATIKGALRHGEVIDVDQVPKLDLILTGSVAVNLKGARIGKGGGFSDLEYALLAEGGTVSDRTVVVTTVHPIQILRENLPVTTHDIPVDLIATPRAAIEVERAYKRPTGILWDHLQPPQIHEIPVLERIGYA